MAALFTKYQMSQRDKKNNSTKRAAIHASDQFPL